MSGTGDWPGDTAETQLLGVPGPERQLLAALAVVGHASLSADELADLGVVPDVIPLLEDLERRGLVHVDERRRYAVFRNVGEQLRRTDVALATGERLQSYFATLAQRGALTPARLDDDAGAILGLAEWAVETGRYEGLLELVKALQAPFAIAQRTGQWLTLLERAHLAARTLGDRQSEIWTLRQLATASASAGNAEAAQRYLREADELQFGPTPPTRAQTRETTVVAPPPPPPAERSGGVPAWVLWTLGIVVALVAGVGLGFALDSGSSSSSDTTAPVSVTLTRPGTTFTTQETLTLPATTVVTTSVSTETTTVTTTTTQTTTVTG